MDGYINMNRPGGGEPAPDFKKLSDTIETNIQKITQNVSSMQKMLNQLNNSQDSHDTRNQYQNIQNYTQQLAHDTSSLLKTLMKIQLTGDQLQQKLTREKLSDEFLTALGALQNTHRNAAQKTSEEVRKHKPQTVYLPRPYSSGTSNNEHIEMEASDRRRQQQQMQGPSEKELREYEEQEQRVLELERSITDVNDIFKEFGSVVHNQSSIIDSIEANIENTSSHVESGVEQLRQTSNYQNKLRKKKLYLILVAVVILAIILILIFSH